MKKVVVLLLCSLVLISGCSIKKTGDITDAEKFSVEYEVSKENPFNYAKIDEVLQVFEDGTGIVFFGNPDSDWSKESAKILEEALEYKNVSEKVYYYNPVRIRDDNTEEYQILVEKLFDYLEDDNDENPYLYIPDIYFVHNGKILGHNNDLASMEGYVDEVMTTKRREEVKDKYIELLNEYIVRE